MNQKATKGQKPRPYLLKNTVQHYSWGKCNDHAFIANLLGITPEQDKPYAELWMGVHPNAPSMVIDPVRGEIGLSEWIAEDIVKHLNSDQSGKPPQKLSYLFKVLSAEQALSIQAHPNKQQAEQLHHGDKKHYPDDNHKPELAIAIDSLDALVGFISQEDYEALLVSTPELPAALNHEHHESTLREDVLKLLELWETETEKIKTCITAISHRLSQQDRLSRAETLFMELQHIHGTEDIGLLFSLLMNHVSLGPGEAVFLAPGIPHAYLKGNIIECMANSDNVVRLGLTEKFCDAKALSQILNFGENTFHVETTTHDHVTEYLTPVDEFNVKALDLPDGTIKKYNSQTKLSLFFVLKGEIALTNCSNNDSCCYMYRQGSAFIAPAELTEFTLQARADAKVYQVN